MSWRYTASRLRAFGMSAGCLLPMIVFLARWGWGTFYFALAGVAFFAVLEFFGYHITVLIRRMRCWMVGKERDGTPHHKRGWYA